MKPKLLLIDGDIFAFRYAAAAEEGFDWGDGQFTLTADANTAFANMKADIEHKLVQLKADRLIVCLSDDHYSWRKERVYPLYKSKRTDRKPMALAALKRMMRDEFEVKDKPTLEADDVMGIIATNPLIYGEYEKVIVSRDKDMKTIPGVVAMIKADDTIEETFIDEASADYAHMVQTMTGDVVDGYPGCKSIGPVKAAKIATEGWDAIRAAFLKAGHDEDHFLAMARCARILRSTDFNYRTQEPILWTPPQSSP